MRAIILASAALLFTSNVYAWGSEKQTSFSKVVCVDVERSAGTTADKMAEAIRTAAILSTVVSVSAPAGVSATVAPGMTYSNQVAPQTFAQLCVTVNLQPNK